jgi:YhcH/YjgK/YiaL family protein
MITDLLSCCSRYAGISPLFAEVFQYIEEYFGTSAGDGTSRPESPKAAESPAALPGREEVKIVYPSYETQPQEERLFEVHRRYVDLQYLLEGRELVCWAPYEELAVEHEYDEERDIAFLSGEARASFLLSAGCFAVFFPRDAHKPNCRAAEKSEKVRKIVLKIPVSMVE